MQIKTNAPYAMLRLTDELKYCHKIQCVCVVIATKYTSPSSTFVSNNSSSKSVYLIKQNGYIIDNRNVYIMKKNVKKKHEKIDFEMSLVSAQFYINKNTKSYSL